MFVRREPTPADSARSTGAVARGLLVDRLRGKGRRPNRRRLRWLPTVDRLGPRAIPAVDSLSAASSDPPGASETAPLDEREASEDAPERSDFVSRALLPLAALGGSDLDRSTIRADQIDRTKGQSLLPTGTALLPPGQTGTIATASLGPGANLGPAAARQGNSRGQAISLVPNNQPDRDAASAGISSTSISQAEQTQSRPLSKARSLTIRAAIGDAIDVDAIIEMLELEVPLEEEAEELRESNVFTLTSSLGIEPLAGRAARETITEETSVVSLSGSDRMAMVTILIPRTVRDPESPVPWIGAGTTLGEAGGPPISEPDRFSYGLDEPIDPLAIWGAPPPPWRPDDLPGSSAAEEPPPVRQSTLLGLAAVGLAARLRACWPGPPGWARAGRAFVEGASTNRRRREVRPGIDRRDRISARGAGDSAPKIGDRDEPRGRRDWGRVD
ncbi:hypothetical protein [Tautonia sociabilis]|uniref:Uncharacterized protein n=1 Tax=Tautonia sociabilis TaxID=2080755 RepID=A0A432MS02_9BACT|nr:hypothetical protein [Tautonia sociabilis]RUL89725.1 hypothetical protein TsocGM_00740 [Tautonia sociabilis]